MMSPLHCLQAIPGFTNATINGRMACGSTGETFLVSRGDEEQYVLRLRFPGAKLFVPDPFAETRLSLLACQAGLAPEPVYCSADGQYSLRRYLPGNVWSDADLYADGGRQALGSLLARVHQLPVSGSSDGWAERALLRYSSVISHDVSTVLNAGLAALADLERLPALNALCHGDVVCGNVLHSSGSLRLIDWEYARIADPYFDLAAVLRHHRLDADASAELLDAYAAVTGDSPSQRRLGAWSSYYCALERLWLLALESYTPIQRR
ncbi:MAG: phosphotransferase [Gammaproteobacteria bacterium]|nr:phosphotransferase [Gammaproteobacteria bacterium]